MKKITVTRQDGVFDILLMKHKTFQGYSFINLTKQHICPCVFNTEDDAIKDLERYVTNGKIIKYKIQE